MEVKLNSRKPDIENLYKVLRREKPDRPTLFELFLNDSLYEKLAGRPLPKSAVWGNFEYLKLVIEAYAAAGYDFAWTNGSDFGFPSNLHMENGKSTVSLNSGACITDWASFENYKWQEPENADYSMLEKITDYLPEGMKLMVLGPSGVMENAIQLAGFDNLCFMIYEDPELAKALFDNIGSRILKHYEIATSFDSVGLVMCNDDWGFKTQTFISPKHLREYVIPWHKKFVELAHSRKIPAVLHSCGNLVSVMDDIIDTIGFDGKHSYEDTITPVEEAYEKWHERIGIIGGLDVNFLVQNDEAVITKRARDMLDRAAGRGAYALGSGNSIPYYVPQDHYFAMIKAALEY